MGVAAGLPFQRNISNPKADTRAKSRPRFETGRRGSCPPGNEHRGQAADQRDGASRRKPRFTFNFGQYPGNTPFVFPIAIPPETSDNACVNSSEETNAIDLEVVGPEHEFGSTSYFFDCMVKAAGESHARKVASKRRTRLPSPRPSLPSALPSSQLGTSQRAFAQA